MAKTEGSSDSEFRDWAHLLPGDIVHKISSKVKSIADYVRFRAVCSPWRSASDPKRRQYLPWLMFPEDNPTHVYFDDIWESKRRMFDIPEAKGMTYCASYRGWLLLADHEGREVFLLNPLTRANPLARARIELPSFAGPVKRRGYDSDEPYYENLSFPLNYMASFAKSKVTFSADLTDPNCLITVFLSRCIVLCCRVGDKYWTLISSSLNLAKMLTDATYYNGRFYILKEESMTIIEYDKPKQKIVAMPELKAVHKCFLEGKPGVYVLAVHPQEKFVLYQLLEQPLMLKQITDTSNNTAIFYGDDYPCLTVCADDWDSLDGGSVYMAKKCVPNASTWAVGWYYTIYSAPWDGQKIEHMVCDLGKEPQFRPRAPVAMWFQPSIV